MKTLKIAAAMACIAFLPNLASAADGATLFKKCKFCHSLEAGKNKMGPSLHNITGKPAGKVAGFKRYSDRFKAADFIWTDKNLDEFFQNPKKISKMTARLSKAEDRAAMIEFLKTK
ncbi:MAG: c-type cytochrome [Magnetovibrio sp.]|nr:c-type cytochrome [Magnetovibrio sp.]